MLSWLIKKWYRKGKFFVRCGKYEFSHFGGALRKCTSEVHLRSVKVVDFLEKNGIERESSL